MYKIKITQKLESDLYAQYSGIWLDKPCDINLSRENGEVKNSIKLNTNDEILINTEPVGNEIKNNELILCALVILNKEIKVNGVLSVYAKNPSRGILITITKLN